MGGIAAGNGGSLFWSHWPSIWTSAAKTASTSTHKHAHRLSLFGIIYPSFLLVSHPSVLSSFLPSHSLPPLPRVPCLSTPVLRLPFMQAQRGVFLFHSRDTRPLASVHTVPRIGRARTARSVGSNSKRCSPHTPHQHRPPLFPPSLTAGAPRFSAPIGIPVWNEFFPLSRFLRLVELNCFAQCVIFSSRIKARLPKAFSPHDLAPRQITSNKHIQHANLWTGLPFSS